MLHLTIKTRSRYLCTFLLVILLSLGHAPLGHGAAPPSELKVGALLPLSGSLAEYGRSCQASLNQALEDVQRHWKIKGYQTTLKVLVEDTASDPQTALAGLKNLEAAGVKMVVGPASSGECQATVDYANDQGLLLISPTSSAQSLALAGDNLYRLVPSDQNQAQAMAALMWEQGMRALVPIWRQDVYGIGLRDDLTQAFTALGGRVYQGAGYDPSRPDWPSARALAAAQVGRALAAQGANAVAVALIAYQEGVDLLALVPAPSLLNQARWYASDGLAKSAALLADPAAASLAASVELSSLSFTREDHLSPTPGLVLADRSVREEVAERLGGAADPPAYGAYDALWLAALAHETAGWSAPIASLKQALETETGRRVGLNGVLRLDAAGDLDYWSYGFHQVKATAQGYAWSTLAVYHKDLGKSSLVFAHDPKPSGWPAPVATYTLGALLPLSGSAAQAGLDIRAGLEEALVSVNRHLALAGFQTVIKLEVRDTQSDDAAALDGLRALADAGVRVVLGPLKSSACQAVLPMANQEGLLLISSGSGAPSLALANDSLYRMLPSDLWQGRALAQLMWEDGIKAAVVIHRGDIWGQELSQSFAAAFGELGGQVLSNLDYDPQASEAGVYLPGLASAATSALAGQAADSVAVLHIAMEEGVTALAQAGNYSALNQVAWYGSDGLAQSPVLLANPEAAAFAAARGYTASIYALRVSGHMATYSIPREVFFDRITERLGREPISYAFNAWDSLWLATAALLDSDWADQAALLGPALARASGQYLGLSNFMALDAYGDRQYGDYGFYQVTPSAAGSGWVQTGTYHFHPPAYWPPAITH